MRIASIDDGAKRIIVGHDPAHIFDGSDPQENPANLEPIGTGPFMFSSRTPDEELVLVKNPDYFKEGLPILDEVVMRVIPDEGSQVLARSRGRSTRNTIDPDARKAIYRTLQEILVEELPYFWLVEISSTRIFTSECSGFRPFGHFAEAASCQRE